MHLNNQQIFPVQFQATYKLFNCRSDLESDCELFGSYTHSDYCATATERGQFYSPIYLAFNPLLTCPLKKVS